MESSGDRAGAAFEELALEVVEPLRRYLARRTDPTTADDVLSETLVVCWRRLDEVPREAAVPWSIGVARRVLSNSVRAQGRRGRLLGRLMSIEPRPAASLGAPDEREDVLGAALEELRPADAELLRLWAWEELSAAEVGVVLGISSGAASVRLHRARERLRAQLLGMGVSGRGVPDMKGVRGGVSLMGEGRDAELRLALTRADPAQDLAPLTAEMVRARTEKVMQESGRNGREAPSRARSWGALGGVLAATAAVTAVVVLGASNQAATILEVPVTDASASCAVITPEALRERQVAFAAVVSAVEDGVVTLDVTERFKGEVGGSVEVEQPSDPQMGYVVGPFTVGESYLISTDAGRVSVCGQSGVESPELRALYDEAYRG